MSIYYMLMEEEYEGDPANIGMIMMKVNQELYACTKLKLAIYMGKTEEDIEQFSQQQGTELLLEEILMINMNDEEKIEKILKYIEEIGGKKGEMLIIDPYIFPRNITEEYKNMLMSIFRKGEFNKLSIVTDSSNYNESLFNEIENFLGSKIQINFSSEFHDRFWIANENKGFILGTSLNGIGKKYSSINLLDEEDVKEIMGLVKILKK